MDIFLKIMGALFILVMAVVFMAIAVAIILHKIDIQQEDEIEL